MADDKSYVVTTGKLSQFSKGAIVPTAQLLGQEERLLRKGAIRVATPEEIEAGKATFADDNSAKRVSLDQQIADMQKHIELLSRQNSELEAKNREYRSPDDVRSAHVVATDETGGQGEPQTEEEK